MKRTASPDRSLKFGRKLKTAKFSFQSEKENLQIKRFQSENFSEKISFHWFDENPLWQNLLKRTFDEHFDCSKSFLDAHPMITSRMRSILFDWLIEVSEVYHLHRETYHLSIAFVDQYLCRTKNLAKDKFQLLGVTSLFLASKIEEIYPPRLEDFTYVTDNTCSEDQILQMELDLTNTLNWHMNPVTTINWLLMYLHVQHEFKSKRLNEILRISMQNDVQRSKDFLDLFSNAVRLIDFCSLDLNFCQFSKNILAAAAIRLCQIDWPVERLTGLTKIDLDECQRWMKPFAEVLKENSMKISMKSSVNVPSDEFYSIQIHNVSIELFDLVEAKRPIKSTKRPLKNLLNQISFNDENSTIRG